MLYIMKGSNLFLRKDKFKRQAYHAERKGQYFQVDLMDFSSVQGGYVMNCIDVFTRYAASCKLKNKTSSEIQRGLSEIFKLMGTPENLQSDMESGLYSNENEAWLKSHNVNLYSVYNSYSGTNSAPIVERLNRTAKQFMNDKIRYDENLNKKAISWASISTQVSQQFPNDYNNKVHSFLKNISPAQAWSGNNNTHIQKIQFGHMNEEKINKREDKRIFNIGDTVLLQKEKNYHRPKSESQFYTDKYMISKINNTNPITYKLTDENGEVLDSNFYKQQMLIIPKNNNIKNTDAKPDVIMPEKIPIDKHKPEKMITRSQTLRSLFKK